jgi:hypothetical protein
MITQSTSPMSYFPEARQFSAWRRMRRARAGRRAESGRKVGDEKEANEPDV